MAADSQNLPLLQEQAEAVCRKMAGRLPSADGQAFARRAGHLSSFVRFGLDEPVAIGRLQGAAEQLRDTSRLDVLLPKILDGALSLMGADLGNVQLLDPTSGVLNIVTQSGFGSEFVEYFTAVDDDHSACGRAARHGAQTVIADVTTDAGFAPHREIAAAAGFRAVQSTPLTDSAGRLIGMVSTHSRLPGPPSGRDLRILELYADLAGEAAARHLGWPSGDLGWPSRDAGRGDAGRGDAGRGEAARGDAGRGEAARGDAGRGEAGAGPERYDGRSRLPSAPGSPEMAVAEFANEIVHRLFAAGLSLASAQAIAGQGAVGDRVAAAVDELDRAIRDIRAKILRMR